LPAGAPLIFPGKGTVPQAIAQHRSFWIFASAGVPSAAELTPVLARVGYRVTYYRFFPATTSLTVVRVATG